MTRRWTIIGVAMSVVPFAGCARSGRDFDFSTVRGFEVGRSTKAQVRSAMGAPQSTKHVEQSEVWEYSFAEYTSALVPREGSTNSSKKATFVFTGDRLTDLSWGYFAQRSSPAEDGGVQWGVGFDPDKMEKTPKGTAASAIEKEFGLPTGRTFDRHGKTTSMTYSWSRSGYEGQLAVLTFSDEKLVSVVVRR